MDSPDANLIAEAKARIIAQGPCAICGGPYARHRMIDATREGVEAGDHIEQVADDYGFTVDTLRAEWAALEELAPRRRR